MRFYTQTHQHYCGIDLHARTMYLCILDQEGQVRLHRNMKATPEAFLDAIAPYREDLVSSDIHSCAVRRHPVLRT